MHMGEPIYSPLCALQMLPATVGLIASRLSYPLGLACNEIEGLWLKWPFLSTEFPPADVHTPNVNEKIGSGKETEARKIAFKLQR